MKWIVRLKHIHEETGLSAYRVSKETGISISTVLRYVANDEVAQDYLPIHVVTLINFYGADWRDPSVLEAIEDESQPEPAVA